MDSEGRTTVNNDVFQHIVDVVIKGMDDIVDRKELPKGFPTDLFSRLTPQVVVTKDESPDYDFGDVIFELKLTTIYGIKIPEVATKVRQEIAKAVEELTGYKVKKVDIVFDKIVDMDELDTAEKKA